MSLDRPLWMRWVLQSSDGHRRVWVIICMHCWWSGFGRDPAETADRGRRHVRNRHSRNKWEKWV
jgi:hypothetical protein